MAYTPATTASNYLPMNHLPPLWTQSTEAACLRQSLQSGGRSVLMLDYDGTLAPFRIDRFQAVPYGGVEDRLEVLSRLSTVRLVLVSGRSARELAKLLRPGIKVEIWGSHGQEQLRSDGSYQLFALDPTRRNALDAARMKLTDLGLAGRLEVKPSSVAVHWRGVDASAQDWIRSAAESVFAQVAEPASLELLPFDGGLELRSTDRTKGTAVRQILSQESGSRPVAYLGDDLTDEDAFEAMGSRGYSVLVRAEVRESAARFWLRPPEELLELLDNWITGAS
jgi:trehalose-phosphatase